MFVMRNKEKIKKIVGLAATEESKNESKEPMMAQIKPSRVEQVEKTQLNTKIRFNIVDQMGFDNASLAMYQDAQKQGLNADEQEFTDLVITTRSKKTNLTQEELER